MGFVRNSDSALCCAVFRDTRSAKEIEKIAISDNYITTIWNNEIQIVNIEKNRMIQDESTEFGRVMVSDILWLDMVDDTILYFFSNKFEGEIAELPEDIRESLSSKNGEGKFIGVGKNVKLPTYVDSDFVCAILNPEYKKETVIKPPPVQLLSDISWHDGIWIADYDKLWHLPEGESEWDSIVLEKDRPIRHVSGYNDVTVVVFDDDLAVSIDDDGNIVSQVKLGDWIDVGFGSVTDLYGDTIATANGSIIKFGKITDKEPQFVFNLEDAR